MAIEIHTDENYAAVNSSFLALEHFLVGNSSREIGCIERIYEHFHNRLNQISDPRARERYKGILGSLDNSAVEDLNVLLGNFKADYDSKWEELKDKIERKDLAGSMNFAGSRRVEIYRSLGVIRETTEEIFNMSSALSTEFVRRYHQFAHFLNEPKIELTAAKAKSVELILCLKRDVDSHLFSFRLGEFR